MTNIIAEADLAARSQGGYTGPTMLECAYIDQGYVLPETWTWSEVHRWRRQFGQPEETVPLMKSRHGFWVWGQPRDSVGQPLMTELADDLADLDFEPRGD